jgi:hypothetical protein
MHCVRPSEVALVGPSRAGLSRAISMRAILSSLACIVDFLIVIHDLIYIVNKYFEISLI